METSEGDIELAVCIVYRRLENRRFPLLKMSQCDEHDAVMVDQAHKFNSEASYEARGVYSPTTKDLELQHVNIQVTAGTANFKTTFPDILSAERYKLPLVKSNDLVNKRLSTPMRFWQPQVNFAVWCATAGCGVSSGDHLYSGTPMARSVYRFHVYYQIRRILEEMQVPLPQDGGAWDAFDVPYNRRAYERICAEFGVSPHTDWWIRYPNHGLGRVYWYVTHMGPQLLGGGAAEHYDPKVMTFTEKTTNERYQIQYIKQDAPDAGVAWKQLIPNKSQGFTRPGVERLNASIRTYVWAILGAQSQTRSSIIGTGTAFDAQRQFLANIEDAISSPVDLPSAIANYQDVLQYARSKVNFAFGIGLYMAPSNMDLQIGTIQDYNNEIVIAGSGQKLGVNDGINATPSPPPVQDMDGPAARPAQPDMAVPSPATMTRAQRLAQSARPAQSDVAAPDPTTLKWTQGPTQPARPAQPDAQAADHEDEKTALVVGGVVVGLLALWLLS